MSGEGRLGLVYLAFILFSAWTYARRERKQQAREEAKQIRNPLLDQLFALFSGFIICAVMVGLFLWLDSRGWSYSRYRWVGYAVLLVLGLLFVKISEKVARARKS